MQEPNMAIHKANSTLMKLIILALPTVRIITLSTHNTMNMKASATHIFSKHDSILMYLSAKQYPIVPHNTIMIQMADNSFRNWR